MIKAETHSILDAVGNTPLVEIPSLSKLTGCQVLAKCEFLNPGGSIKDRAAKGIIRAAIQSGALLPGGTIVEGTAGNTGIGLATLARSLGYRVVVTMPDNQAQEKYDLLRALGVDVLKFKPVPFANPEHFYHQAKRLADEKNYYWANQFENTANQESHYLTTGPEIWAQTQGQIDTFVCAVGSGGTIAGVSRFLKEQSPKIKIVAADPFGSGIYSYITQKVFKSEGSSVTEGIGIMRLTENFKHARVDQSMQISDQEMISMLFHVARNDGLFVGTSAALNLAAAYRIANESKNQNLRIVTVLCDSGTRYQSKLLSNQWLNERRLDAMEMLK